MVKGRSKFKQNLGPSERQLKVSETIKRIISEALNIDKIYSSFLKDISITVTEVRVSPDLKNASVFVTPFAASNITEVLDCLNGNLYLLNSYLATRTHLRYLPKIIFKYDQTFDEAQRLNKIIETIED